MKLRALAALALSACAVPAATRVEVDAPEGADASAADAMPDAHADAGVDATPDAMLLPASLSGNPASAASFGDVVLGQTSGAQGYTISNDGDLASGAISIALDDSAAGFAIGNDLCSGAPLAGHHSCTFAVTFSPGAAGAAATTVHVVASPGGDVARDLAGNGLEPGTIDLVEHGHDFGNWGVDAGALKHTFDLTNGGQVAIGAPAIAIGGATDAFFLDATTCTQALAPKAHCTVTVRFDPSTVGAKPGSLTVTSSPGGSDAATLSGSGVAHVTVTRAGTGTGAVASNQTGIDCGATCDADFSSTPVTLNATTPAGSTFTGWSGDCAGTGSCTLDLSGAKHVTATFTAITPTLAVAKTGGGAGTIASAPAGIDCGSACSAQFAYATVVTLTATPATGSTFAGFSGACSGTGPCVVTMDQVHSVVAQFDAITPTLAVAIAGTGDGAVVSKPDGVACQPTCNAVFAYATVVTLTATAATGSAFTGWSGACAGANATCTVTMDQARNVTATFDALTPTLTVVRAGSGGGAVTSSTGGIDCGSNCSASFAYGTVVTLTATATTGSDFTGWSGACTGTGACTVAMDQPRAVTATFAPFTPTLTVSKAGTGGGTVASAPAGISCGATCAHAYAFGDTVTLTATAANGSTFTGWSGACAGTTATCTLTMDQTRNVTATFDQLTPAVTVTLAGGGTGAVTSSPGGIDCGSSCSAGFPFNTSVTLTAAAATGSTFAGWSGACAGTTATCVVVADRARAVTAQFDAVTPPLTVTLAGNGGGRVTSSPAGIDCTSASCTSTFAYAQTVTLMPAASAGSSFAGWSGACNGSGTCTVSMTTARNVTATFTLNSYPLTITPAGNGTGAVAASPMGTACGAGCASYTYGTVVVLTATAGIGSSFTGWTGDCTGAAATCTLTLDQTRNVTATFTLRQYTINLTTTGAGAVTLSPTGTACGAGCSSYSYGQPVTLTATPSTGSIFSGWSGAGAGACAGSTSATCTVTVDQQRSITAAFALTTVDLTITRAGSGSGNVNLAPGGASCGAGCSTYPYGTVVTMTASATAGSTFAGWSGSGAGTCAGTTVATCTVTMDQPRSVTATFTLDNEPLTLANAGNGTGMVSTSASGGNCGASCTSYPYNTQITLTATAGIGSTFAGWSGDAGTCTGSTATSCVVIMDRPRAITATFSLVPEQLTWSTTGAGTGTIAPSPPGTSCGAGCAKFDYNTPVTLTATPQAGSTFAGWSGACTNPSGTCTVTMTQMLSVSARFDPIPETLTWTNPGTGNGAVSASPAGTSCGTGCFSFNYGTPVVLTASAQPGSTFIGWGGACSGTGACNVTMTGAQTVTARFDLVPENLTWTLAGSGGGTIAATPPGTSCGGACLTFNYGTPVTLTATPSVGSIFTGWSGAGCSGNGSCVVTMTSGQAVTATFTLSTQTLTWSTTGNGSGAPSPTPPGTGCGNGCATYNYGTSVTMAANPATGSSFAGWSNACTGTGACVIPMTTTRAVTASYALNSYPVTASVTGGGTIVSSPAAINCGNGNTACSASWLYNSPVTLTASPATGWTFTAWSGACSGGPTCPLTVDGPKTVGATFTAITPTLTVSKSGNGAGTITDSAGKINCGGTCSGTYAFSQGVTLTATPAAGSSFTSWSGACSGPGTCSVTMDQVRNVTANFTLNSYTLTLGFVGDAGGSVNVNGTVYTSSAAPSFLYGTAVTLTPTANGGAVFAGFGGACSGTGACAITIGGPTSVSAEFDRSTYTLFETRETPHRVDSSPAGISNCGGAGTVWTCSNPYARGTGVTLTVTPKCSKLTFVSQIDWTGCTPIDDPNNPNTPTQCVASMYSDVTVDVSVLCETIQ